MRRIAVVSVILENPINTQSLFNTIVAENKAIVKGRMGIPLEEGVTVITIILIGDVNDINSLTGKLGKLPNTQVKTAISKMEY